MSFRFVYVDGEKTQLGPEVIQDFDKVRVIPPQMIDFDSPDSSMSSQTLPKQAVAESSQAAVEK